MWLTSRHLEGGKAEIRFVVGSERVHDGYKCKNAKKMQIWVCALLFTIHKGTGRVGESHSNPNPPGSGKWEMLIR